MWQKLYRDVRYPFSYLQCITLACKILFPLLSQVSSAEASNTFALAEIEILTARISELTTEKQIVVEQLKELQDDHTVEKLSRSESIHIVVSEYFILQLIQTFHVCVHLNSTDP